MKTLPPIRLKPDHYEHIETEINRYFLDTLYRPLKELLGIEFRNQKNPLIEAIYNGVIDYASGMFTGRFSARTSSMLKKLGATYNAKLNAWFLSGPIPAEIQIAAAQADSRYQALLNSVLKVLDGVTYQPTGLSDQFYKTVEEMDDDFMRSVRSFTIPPRLTPQAKRAIANEWASNLELTIKDWMAKNILSLREKVLRNTLSGNRAENLEKTIQDNYGVSRRKARFLARQETSLLMSGIREQRYKDIGLLKYKWSGSLDERERPDHRLLEGKTFSWDSPPIVDRQKGTKAHPGEDFGCRCIAIPVIDDTGQA